MNITIGDTSVHQKMLDIAVKKIMEEREKLLAAYIAETGLKPSEVLQVEETGHDGLNFYWLRRISETDALKSALEFLKSGEMMRAIAVIEKALTGLPNS